MEIDEIKKISNPYTPLTAKINKRDFIGREDILNKLRIILNDYQKSLKLKNILISGERSVGKSTLMNRFKNILEDFNFAIFEIELPRESDIPIDEFEFFKELIGDLFAKYSINGNFFDQEQTEIWYSLTGGSYQHEKSTYLDRKLFFPTQYANKIKGLRESLNFKQIESDFTKIMNELLKKESECKGLVLLIDEFQELSKNTYLLEILRRLSENLVGFMIIGSGLPTFLGNPTFEKYSRICESLTLRNLSRKESLDLIYNPLAKAAKINRYEAEKCFHDSTVMEILERTQGNPLHIKLLCGNLFENFSNSSCNKPMQLNREVMDSVMEYYCNNSTASRKIRNSLETASSEQLKTFARLYYYEGFTLRASILGEIAFASIQDDIVETVRSKIVNDFIEIYDLGLFKLNGVDIANLSKLTFNELANVSYKFIGDQIDKLYAIYYFENVARKQLVSHPGNDFETFLANKLAKSIGGATIRRKIPEMASESKLLSFHTISQDNIEAGKELVRNFENLEKIDTEKALTDCQKKLITEISDKFNLSLPAIYLSAFSFEGYYVLITNVTIRGKEKTIYNYFPIKGNLEDITKVKEKIEDYSEFIDSSLDEYAIKINWMYLYFLQKKPLLLIYMVDFNDEQNALLEVVRKRDFHAAINISEHLFHLNLTFGKDYKPVTNIEIYNNYGFCLINVDDYKRAKEIFTEISEMYLISKVNLAYINYLEKNHHEAKRILKGIFKKRLSENYDVAFLHLYLPHSKLSKENIIVEDVKMADVVSWNLALLACQSGEEFVVYNSYLKAVKISQNNQLIHIRVNSWIYYYNHRLEDAISEISKAIKLCKEEDLLLVLENDLGIFQNEKNNMIMSHNK